MDLIPESATVVRELSAVTGTDVAADVRDVADRVRELVPSCVGISISVEYGALTFTLVASSQEAAALDAVQYATAGPCVDSLRTREVHEIDDVLDEGRWQAYSAAAAAANVRSSLSLPLATGGDVWGALNLYAADPRAFVGLHDALRESVGTRSELLVTNADLAFETRRRAEAGPAALEHRALVNRAVGYLMAQHRTDASGARRILESAAGRAGVTLHDAAAALLENAGGC